MNELDQAIENLHGSKPATQSFKPDPIDDILNQQEEMRKRAIQVSATSAIDVQPERRAESIKLAKQYGLDPELVERNFETVQRKAKLESVEPEKLTAEHRRLSDWLSDPNNMALASDELDKLKDLSETINEQGDFEKLYLALGSGFANLNSSVAKIPAMGVDLYTQYAVNPMARALGYAEVGPREGLRNNAVTNFFDSAAESYTAQVPELSDKVIESALAGDFKKSSRALAFQVAANFPQMALTIGSTMAGAPGVGLAAMGGMSAASEYDEALDKGVDQGAAMANAVIAGGAEAAFERMGTIAILKKWEASIGAKLGKDTARKIMADAGKMLGVSIIQEGAEETGTSLVQDASKIATGVNPDIGRMEIASNAANAFVLGGAMGGGMVAPSGFAMGAQRSLEMRRAQELQDFYLALGDKTNELKLKKRLPEASQKLIENLTKDGPVENIFVDPKDMQTYFQSKNMDPLEAATLYGFSKEYQEAVETGTDVKIPLAKWTTTMAETEHFQGLKDDVRFSPDGLSVRENQKIEKQLKADLKLIASQEEDSEVGKPEAELTPDQKRIRSARAVKENVKQQLLALNSPLYGPNEAEQVALLYAKGFNSLGYRSGTDPLELFNRYNLRISLGEDGQIKEQFSRDTLPTNPASTVNEFEVAEIQRDDGGAIIYDAGNLSALRRVISESEIIQGTVKRDGEGFAQGFIGGTSTFPEFFKNKGYTKQSVLKAIDKQMAGESLTEKQRTILDDLYEGYVDSLNRGEMYQSSLPTELFQSAAQAVADVFPAKPAPPTFSKLIALVEQKMGGSADPQQIRAMLKDIKEEEKKWLGVEEFLAGKEKVKKQDFLDFLRANEPEIVDVTLGGEIPAISTDDFTINEDVADREIEGLEAVWSFNVPEALTDSVEYIDVEEVVTDGVRSYEVNFNGNVIGSFETTTEMLNAIQDEISGDTGQRFGNRSSGEVSSTKYQDYTLPGGENYREVLFTLPERSPEINELPDGYTVVEDSADTPFGSTDGYRVVSPTGDRLGTIMPTRQAAQRSAIRALNNERVQKNLDYTSSHFDEKNILAHVRLNDRIDSDGKKVLFVEEIQSDWHQAGRKRGYVGELPKGWTVGPNNTGGDAKFKVYDETNEMQGYGETEPEAIQMATKNLQAVPDAPFKKTWHEYAFKRIVRMAAEGGYDRIAWTTGSQQNERFKLSKFIDRIQYSKSKRDPSKYNVIAYDKGGRDALGGGMMYGKSVDEIEELLGKDIAQKIASDEGEQSDLPNEKVLKGLNLESGGEGMKGFYDKILVDYAKKFGKKFGATVGETSIDPGNTMARISEDNNGSFIVDFDTPTGYGRKKFATREEAETFDRNRSKANATKVHSLDVTDKMRDVAIGEGFELFQSKPFYGDFNAPSGVKSVAVPSLTDDGTTLESAQKEVLSGGELKVRVPRGGEIVIDKTFFEKTKNEVFEPKRPRGDGPLSTEEKRAAVIIAKNIETVMKDAILDSREETRGVGTKASKDLVDHYKRYYGVVNIDGVPFAYQMKAQVLKAARGKPKFQQLYFEFARKLEAPALSGEPDSGEGLKIDQNLRGNNSLFPLPTEISIGDFAKIINSLRAKYPLFQSGEAEDSNRARIVIGANKTMRIELFKKADLSSFLHETGHFWFEVMADLAKEPNANPALVADYQTVKDWLGETDESLDARRAEASEIASRAQRENRELTKEENARINELVEPFEKWARAFELYLAKGEAPSLDLKKAFAHFKVWLINVYKDLRRLNVELTPEIKGVMDRMLATDAELEAAYLGHPPLFKGDAFDGMNPETAEKYQKAIEDAKQEASESLTAKVVEREFKKREAAYKEKRKAVRARIEEEANGLRIYRALSILQKGTLPDGSALPEGTPQIKLDKQSIVQAYGKEFLDRLPRPFVYAKEGGVDYNMAAEMLGFESGDAMLTEMANAQPKKAYIEARTDEEMDVLYPDEVMEQFPAEAVKSAHSEGRSKLLRMELELLVQNNLPVFKDAIRRVARRVPTEAEVRAQARQIIAGKRIAEIKPYTFERAEVKAAKEAGIALAKGDIEAAFEHKRRELLNHELFRAANEAIEEHEKALEFFKKFGQKDEDLAKSRDMDLVNAGRAILSEYDIGKSEKTREEILKYMQAYAPESFESISTLIDSVGLKPGNFDEITHEEFSKLNETVRAIWTLSRQAKNIEIDGKKVAREDAIAELVAQVDAIKEMKPDKEFKKVTGDISENKLGWLGLRARFRRTEAFVTSMDRGFGGPFRTYIWQPISDATSDYRIAKTKTFNELMDILKQWQSESNLIKTPIKSIEIGAEFENKAQLIGAILHTGNESNKEKLLVGYGWGSILEDGSLDSARWDQFMSRMYAEGIVTKADMDFVQRIWDLNESLKPAAQKAHKEMYGFYFNEITANEIQTPFGNYRGGYVPAVADPNQVPEASIRGDKEALLQGGNSSMFPTTGRGFTKSRVENYNVKLSLDLKRIGSHVDKVLRFVHIEPKVKEVARIVTNKKFMASMNEVDPAAVQNIIVPMLQRAAQQSVSKPFTGMGARWLNKYTAELRKRTGLQTMFFNVINTVQQITGFSVALVRVKPRHLRNAIWGYLTGPKAMAQEIASKSKVMQTRLDSQVADVNQTIDDIAIDPSVFESSQRFIQKHGYFLQAATQNIVDVTVWGAAYEQGIESGLSDLDAVRFADSTVKETQGSTAPEDIAAFEAGNPVARLFTMFQGYFNMLVNLAGTEFTLARDMGLRKGAGRMFYVYLMAGLIPAWLSKLIVMAGAGVIDEDDDDEYLDDLLDSLFWSQAETATAMIPFAGPVLNTSMKTWNSKPYDDRIVLSPVINTIEQTAAAPTSVYNAIVNDGSKRKAARDVLTAVGMLSGIPTGPIQRPLSYLADIEDGKANPTGPVDFTRGLITGRPGTPQ